MTAKRRFLHREGTKIAKKKLNQSLNLDCLSVCIRFSSVVKIIFFLRALRALRALRGKTISRLASELSPMN
jgi:hypothetical protein